jgi:hypothetical protein
VTISDRSRFTTGSGVAGLEARRGGGAHGAPAMAGDTPRKRRSVGESREPRLSTELATPKAALWVAVERRP